MYKLSLELFIINNIRVVSNKNLIQKLPADVTNPVIDENSYKRNIDLRILYLDLVIYATHPN